MLQMRPEETVRGRSAIPEAIVPWIEREPASGMPAEASWSRVPVLRLLRSEDGTPPEQPTAVRIARDGTFLFLRFDCDDLDIRATHSRRDAPLWEEDVVELFIAPGPDDPAEYVEIEVNPLGTVFDARVVNPDGRRATMTVDPAWDAAGLAVAVSRPTPARWRVSLAVPWAALCAGEPPRVWRANAFRIERPRDGEAEFSSWSPTFVRPADFHKPACFGRLLLDSAERLP